MGADSATCTNAGTSLCYRPFHGEMDDLKLFDNMRVVDDIFNERYLVQTEDDKRQLLAEGIHMILFLTFDDPYDLELGNFGSGILERFPRRLPSTAGIQSTGTSVQSFELRSEDIDSDISKSRKCEEYLATALTKTAMNLEIKQISDGIMVTTILSVPSYGCLYDASFDVPKIITANTKLQQTQNMQNIPVTYIPDASKMKLQLGNYGFFDSFTFKTGSSDAFQSYGLVQLVQMPRPQLPNGLASMNLWITERTSALIHFPLTGYRSIQVSGITFSAVQFSSLIDFQGEFKQVSVSDITLNNFSLGSVLRPTPTNLVSLGSPSLVSFTQAPSCDDQKGLGTLTYSATSNDLDAFRNSVYKKVPQTPVGSIQLMCSGVNDAPTVSTPMQNIAAEKQIAMMIEIKDIDSPLLFLALAQMPQKMKIYQTDKDASQALGLVSLIAHADVGVGWVTALFSTNELKCLENCRNHAIVGPLVFSENGDGFRVGVKDVLQSQAVMEVSVEFATKFFAKTFVIYGDIPEGMSLTISTIIFIDGNKNLAAIWQGVPKPVSHSYDFFDKYGKQQILKKKLWTIDVCPSWDLTSTYRFEFAKPVGVQSVTVSAIRAYAYDRPVAGGLPFLVFPHDITDTVAGAFQTQKRTKTNEKDDTSVLNPWIHQILFRAQGNQDASGHETLGLIAYDCGSSSLKVHNLTVQIFLQGYDHLPRPLIDNQINLVQFSDKYVSLQGFDPENDPFKIIFINAMWKNSSGTSIWNVQGTGNATIATTELLPGSFVVNPDGRILLIAPAHFGGPNSLKIFFRYQSVKDGLNSIDYSVQINILCAVKYRYLEAEQKCVLCPSGTICNTVGVIEPELCQPGSSSNDAITCKPCQPGSFAAEAGSSSCSLCPPGSYQPNINQSSCIPCSPGTFMSKVGATRCNECGHTSFSASGASLCTLCPLNTVAFTKTSPNITDCRCKEGHYELNNRAGHECLPCCNGAVCRGQRHSPFPLENFWSDRSIWNTSCFFIPCYDVNACQGYPSTSILDIADVDEIVDILAICSDGVEGRFCSRCKAGFWRSVGSVCMQCYTENRDKAAALYFAWTLLYVLGYLLFFNLSFSTRRVVTTLYTHNSIMFLLSRIKVQLPRVFTQAFGIHAFFALDFTFLPHTCISSMLGYESLGYGQTSVFFLGLPLMIILIITVQHFWAKACKRYGPALVSRFGTDDVEGYDGIVFSLIVNVISNNGKFLTDKHIEASYQHGIHSALQGLFGMWPILAVKSLELLSCDSLQAVDDAKTYLVANPDWTCFEGSHRQFFPVALFFAILYVVVLPWFLFSMIL